MDSTPIMLPAMCKAHQRLLLDQVGVGPDGPWISTIMCVQLTLFQGTTAHPSTYERIGGDITRIGELGCLACDRPDVFGETVEAYQRGEIAAVKALGERYVKEGAAYFVV